MPAVAVFRDWLLPISETFIRAQVDALARFDAVYVGCVRFDGLASARQPAVLMRPGLPGWAEKILLRTTGLAPTLVSGLRKYHPVLLHAHFGPDGALALPLARALNIPLVVTFHGFDATVSDGTYAQTRAGRWYLRRRDRLKSGATTVLAVSNFIAAKLSEQGFPREKVQVHYIGVNTEEFKPRCEVARERKVLFVGRLVEKKGCEYLIRAMEPIQKAMPEVELVIVGDGPLRSSLEQLAKSLLRRFTFTGAQPAVRIREWMSHASVLCTPSVVAPSGDAEGFGMVFIEAQASGLPVVSFASGGIPEAVRHGESGYLAPEKDWRALSEYIARLLVESGLWARFSRAGRSFVEREFDLKVQTGKLEQIYEEAIFARRVAANGGESLHADFQPVSVAKS
ncbi:MAG: glycosyltransferase [Candidatus Acidiferrales bacterium]